MPSPEPRPLPTAHLDSASQPYLRELGRLVIAGSRLDELVRAIESLPKPPLAGAPADELSAWITGATMLLDARSRIFAAAASGHFTGATSDAVHVVMPDDSVVAADTEYLERMIQRIHRQDVSGHLLHLQLDPQLSGAGEAGGAGSEPIALHPESGRTAASETAGSLEVG